MERFDLRCTSKYGLVEAIGKARSDRLRSKESLHAY